MCCKPRKAIYRRETTYRNNLMLVLVDLRVKLAFFLLVSPADFMVEMLEEIADGWWTS